MDETVDPLAGGGERDAVSGLAGGDPQGDGQVCLAGAGRAEEDHVLLAGDEIQGAQMGHRLPFQPAQVSEVELLQGLAGGETGHADATLSAMRLSGGDLALQAGGQTPDVSRTRWWRVQRAGRRRPAGPAPVAAPQLRRAPAPLRAVRRMRRGTTFRAPGFRVERQGPGRARQFHTSMATLREDKVEIGRAPVAVECTTLGPGHEDCRRARIAHR